MRVAVYAIAKDEEKFVQRWVDSAKDADAIFLSDTGSSDRTVEIAEEFDVQVSRILISPWRFDDARNASLAVIPDYFDYLICLDLDEVLMPGWRTALEMAHSRGITRPRYTYISKSDEHGNPVVFFAGDKIHARRGYRWKYACHETLVSDRIAETQYPIPLEIRHYPDESKPRSSYIDLLKVAAEEFPAEARCSFYYGRELYFQERNTEAKTELTRFLSLPSSVWDPERAGAMRLLARIDKLNAVSWLERAIAEHPDQRESYVDLAHLHYENANWPECLSAATRALDVKEMAVDFAIFGYAWGHEPWDLAAIASHRLGLYSQAVVYGTRALELADDGARARLEQNLNLYLQANVAASEMP